MFFTFQKMWLWTRRTLWKVKSSSTTLAPCSTLIRCSLRNQICCRKYAARRPRQPQQRRCRHRRRKQQSSPVMITWTITTTLMRQQQRSCRPHRHNQLWQSAQRRRRVRRTSRPFRKNYQRAAVRCQTSCLPTRKATRVQQRRRRRRYRPTKPTHRRWRQARLVGRWMTPPPPPLPPRRRRRFELARMNECGAAWHCVCFYLSGEDGSLRQARN